MGGQVAPMRVQVKMDDGTEEGAWLTVFTGWTDLPGSIEASEEAATVAEEQKQLDDLAGES